jgi:predicted Zn-dependent peptidase
MSKKIVISKNLVLLIDPIKTSEAFSAGLWLNLGSRDEKDHEHGFAHFTEHMLFKGTKKRSHYDIALEIDSVGGEINGATGKENTYCYVNIASEYLKKALDILTDMYFNSSFKEKEFENERRIILDEIDMSIDDHDDYVFELFTRTLWKNMPFGLSVMGEKKDIQDVSIKGLRNFYKKNYHSCRMILSAAGRFSENELQREAESMLKYLNGENEAKYIHEERDKPVPTTGACIQCRDIEQVYFVCGREGYSYRDENRFGMALLNMILGSSFSSRLFQKVREKRGLCYSIASSLTCYSDVGEFTIGFSTSMKNLPFVLDAINNELKLFKGGDIKQEELERAKGRYKGNYILAKENIEWKMVKMALQEMAYGRLIPYDETLKKVESVTLEDLNRMAGDVFNGDRFSFASVGPSGQEKYLKDYHFSF